MTLYASSLRPRVCIGPDGVLTYRGPSSHEVFSGIKSYPARFRSYAPDDGKAWTVRPPYAADALELILRYAPDADVEYTRTSRTHVEDSCQLAGSDHFRTLHLRPTAPVALIEGAYKILARLHHPDAGGCNEGMLALNRAYAALRERVST